MEVKDYSWHQGMSGHYFATVHTIHSAPSGGGGGFGLGHLDMSSLVRLPIAWIGFCIFCIVAVWLITRPRTA